MKTKIVVFAFLLSLLLPTKTYAQEKSSDSSATFAQIQNEQRSDTRAKALQAYLRQFDSPLAPYAGVFVSEADRNAIPWTLVAAISGTEGTFGKFQPGPNCINTWGWGVYGNNTFCFKSYVDAIQTISRELRTRYIDQYGCRYVDDIGRYYAASPTWATHTKWFMNQIEQFKAAFDANLQDNALSISL